ncbi:MAG: hypothetical protein JWP75_2269 [Frondihabitans sp.]|nr:hypothetical protein [Frondihabitans sp.]
MTTSETTDVADRRERLLDDVVDYVLDHGVSGLTLRALAGAVGSNNRMLLYYFGSRDDLIVAALHGAEARFPGMHAIMTGIDAHDLALPERLERAWRTISDPENLPFHRLFFEIFGLASFEREKFAGLLDLIGTEWVDHVARAFADDGVNEATSLALAHETVALWRGFQATLLSTGDAATVERAASAALDSIVARAQAASD